MNKRHRTPVWFEQLRPGNMVCWARAVGDDTNRWVGIIIEVPIGAPVLVYVMWSKNGATLAPMQVWINELSLVSS